MPKKNFLYIVPGIILYVGVILYFFSHTLYRIFTHMDLWSLLSHVLQGKTMIYTLYVFFLFIFFQILFSIVVAMTMLRARYKLIYLQGFLIFAFIPIVALYFGGFGLLHYDFFVLKQLKFLMQNHLISFQQFLPLIGLAWLAFLCALQWVGLQSVIYYLYFKRIPRDVYEISILDGLSGYRYFYAVFYVHLKPMLAISIGALIASATQLFQSTLWVLSTEMKKQTSFLDWFLALTQGDPVKADVYAFFILLFMFLFGFLVMISYQFMDRLKHRKV